MSGAVEEHVVEGEQAGVRLDKFVASLASVGSRRRAREAIDSGKVSVDGRRMGPGDGAQVLSAGSVVAIAWNTPGSAAAANRGRSALERAGVRVVHHDADLLVVDKPPGLLTDTATRKQREQDASVKGLADAWLRKRGQQAFIVHRIDRDTSGLVALACNARAEQNLRAQFAGHRPRRVYWALVRGAVRGDAGSWADPMRWDPTRNVQLPARSGERGAAVGKASYRVRERFGTRATWLEVELQTGRRNQIRLHCQLAGHPLLGERQYLPPGYERDRLAQRQALHARALSLLHPASGERLDFQSDLPGDLSALIAKLRRAG